MKCWQHCTAAWACRSAVVAALCSNVLNRSVSCDTDHTQAPALSRPPLHIAGADRGYDPALGSVPVGQVPVSCSGRGDGLVKLLKF